jgi:tellurite resistance-related uncharacterized protein
MYSCQVLPTSVSQISIHGHQKTLVYSAPIKNKATLPKLIFHSHQTIRDLSGTLEIVQKFTPTRVDVCIDEDEEY